MAKQYSGQKEETGTYAGKEETDRTYVLQYPKLLENVGIPRRVLKSCRAKFEMKSNNT